MINKPVEVKGGVKHKLFLILPCQGNSVEYFEKGLSLLKKFPPSKINATYMKKIGVLRSVPALEVIYH